MQLDPPPPGAPLTPATHPNIMVLAPATAHDPRVKRTYHSTRRNLAGAAATNTENANPVVSERELTADDECSQELEEPTLQDHVGRGARTAPNCSLNWWRLPLDAPIQDCKRGRQVTCTTVTPHMRQCRALRADAVHSVAHICAETAYLTLPCMQCYAGTLPALRMRRCKARFTADRVREIRQRAMDTVQCNDDLTNFVSQFVQPYTDDRHQSVGCIDGKPVCRTFLCSLLCVGNTRINNLRGTPTAHGLPAPAG